MYKIYRAGTVDHAIALGLEELKLREEDVRIDVLERGSKGFLGLGKKDAEVKLTIINPELKTYGSIEDVINRGQAETAAASEEAPAGDPEADSGAGQPEVEDDVQEEDAVLEEIQPEAETEAPDEIVEEADEAVEEASRLSFDEAAARTARYIQDVISDMNIDSAATYKIEGNRAYIELESELAAKLIGKRGQTLNALQEIAQNYLNTIYRSYGVIILDVENYREKRRETLENLAVNMAKKAVRTNQPVRLEPMPSFERKIMHNVLSGRDDINTYSEGSEPNRYLVIEKK